MKKQEKKQEHPDGQWIDIMGGVLKGGVVSTLLTVLLLLLCALFISLGVMGERMMEGAALGCCLLGGAVGGWSAAKKVGKRVLLGLGAGAVEFLLLLTVGLFLYEGTSLENGGVGILLACCFGGAIGGIVKRAPKKKHRH